MMTNIETAYNQVHNQLKNKFDTDEEFQKELEHLLHFYGQKFVVRAKKNEQLQYIENQLGDVVKSQFFQGYYIMKSILLDKETHFPEDVWILNKGVIRNELPILLDTMYSDNQEEWYQTDLARSVGMKLIDMFDEVYDLVLQMRKDIALYGVYKAFIEDQRYKGDLEQTKTSLLLGNPLDLQFLNPQVYMQAQFITNEQEIWDLFKWSSLKQSGGWVGSIHFSRIPIESGQEFYLLEYTISETIADNEKYGIMERLINTLPTNIKAVLQTRVYHVRELETLIPSE